MNHTPRTQNTVNANQRDRIRQLERKAGKDARLRTYELGSSSQYGAVAVTTLADTPEWDVWEGGQLVALIARLQTTGTTNTVVEFYLEGVSLGTVTLGSGEARDVAYPGDARAKSGDGICAVVTTAGTGAKGLSAFVRMKG